MFKHYSVFASLCLLVSATACDSNPTAVASSAANMSALQQQQLERPAATAVQPYAYRIGTGDEIEVKFFFTPELNDRLTVRPDGKISVMFAQDVQAAGLTTEELAISLKEKLAPHVKQLDLVVIVRNFASQKAYVGGEVAKPGPVQLSAHENLLQVINNAGWVTPLASRDKVLLIRRGPDGRDAIYPLNFRKILSGEDTSHNITLIAGDMVLVPPSGIVEMDRWVDQNIRQMIPINAGVFVNSGR